MKFMKLLMVLVTLALVTVSPVALGNWGSAYIQVDFTSADGLSTYGTLYKQEMNRMKRKKFHQECRRYGHHL